MSTQTVASPEKAAYNLKRQQEQVVKLARQLKENPTDFVSEHNLEIYRGNVRKIATWLIRTHNSIAFIKQMESGTDDASERISELFGVTVESEYKGIASAFEYYKDYSWLNRVDLPQFDLVKTTAFTTEDTQGNRDKADVLLQRLLNESPYLNPVAAQTQAT